MQMTKTGSNSPKLAEGQLAAAANRARSFVERRKTLGRVLLALLGLVAAGVAIAYQLASRTAERPPAASRPLPLNAQQQLAGYSFTRSEGGHQVFTVRAERTLTFRGGEPTTLDGVEVEIFGRTGQQHDLLRTNRCEYNSGLGNFFCSGPVEIQLNAPRASEAPRGPAGVGSSTLGGHQTVFLETSGLSYDQNSSMLTSAAQVRWHYGPASGSAIGLAYSTREGWLELKQAVAASLPVKGPTRVPGSTTLELQAAHLRYARDQQQIDLAGPVNLSEDKRHLTAGHAIIYFDSQNHPTGALLDGGVRAAEENPGSPLSGQAATVKVQVDPSTGDLRKIEASGGVQARRGPGPGTARLAADRMEVNFEGAHFHPSQGTASGNVHLAAEAVAQTRSQPPLPLAASRQSRDSYSREELDAGEVQFTLRPADSTLEHAQTEGPGRLVLVPADPKAGRRVMTAGQLLADFDGKSRVESVRGLAPTRIVFEPAPGRRERAGTMESEADNLQAGFDPAAAELRSLVQSGRFQFIDGDARANADQAEYSAGESVLTLTGNPRLANPDSHIRADRFVLHLTTDTAEGFGQVASSHTGPIDSRPSPSSGPSGAGPKGNAARPSAATNGFDPAVPGVAETTNVLADRVMADRRKQFVHYEGHVRAWRGSDVLESPSLDIYTSERRIVSGSPVLTSDVAPAPSKLQSSDSAPLSAPAGLAGRANKTGSSRQAAPEARGATQPVTIRADRVEYFDLSRKAVYQGNVRMDASGATLQADRLEAYFAAARGPVEASKLDRVEADGRITVIEPGRRATGDHAEYFAGPGKIVMTGGPPTLYDSEKGFATGRSLTFSMVDDSLLIDGGPGSSTVSKHHLSR